MDIIIVLIKLLTICVHLATALDERQHHLTVMRTSMVKTKGTLSGSIIWDQSKSPKKGKEEKNLDTFEVVDYRMKLWNGLQIFGNLPSELFSGFDVSASVDRVVFDERGWDREASPQRGQNQASESLCLSLSLMVCCLVSSEWMPVEAGCLQHAYGGLRRAGLVKSPSHQQADSATPWKHLPERKTSLHTWYAQHTPSNWSVCELTMEESLGACCLRMWPCAVKCKLC